MFDRGREAGVQFAGAYATGASSVACANTHGVRRYCTDHARPTPPSSPSARTAPATPRARSTARTSTSSPSATRRRTKRRCAPDASKTSSPARTTSSSSRPPLARSVRLDEHDRASPAQSYDDGSSFFVGNLGKQVLGDELHARRRRARSRVPPLPVRPRRAAEAPRGARSSAASSARPCVDKAYADRLDFAPTANAWNLGGTEHGSAFHLVDRRRRRHARGAASRSTKHGIWVTRFNYVNGLLEPKTRADDRHHARRHVPHPRRRGRGAPAEPALDAVDRRGVLAHRRPDPRAPPRRHLVQPLRRYDRAGREDRADGTLRGSRRT